MSFKKEIILVGTFHFEQHAEQLKHKESEIEELVSYLFDFSPTKIALEWDGSQDKTLNEEYYNSESSYQIDEVQQLGFRLAKKMQHNRVYGVNWDGHLTKEDMANFNHVVQSSYPEIYKNITSLTENTPVITSELSLISSYEKLNESEYIRNLEKMYLSFVEVQSDQGEMVGFNILNKWFERELMIFKNLVNITSEDTNERIVLVIGSDHLWMLRKLFEGKGWEVINPFHGQEFKQ